MEKPTPVRYGEMVWVKKPVNLENKTIKMLKCFKIIGKRTTSLSVILITDCIFPLLL